VSWDAAQATRSHQTSAALDTTQAAQLDAATPTP